MASNPAGAVESWSRFHPSNRNRRCRSCSNAALFNRTGDRRTDRLDDVLTPDMPPLISLRDPSFVSPTTGLMERTASFPGRESM